MVAMCVMHRWTVPLTLASPLILKCISQSQKTECSWWKGITYISINYCCVTTTLEKRKPRGVDLLISWRKWPNGRDTTNQKCHIFHYANISPTKDCLLNLGMIGTYILVKLEQATKFYLNLLHPSTLTHISVTRPPWLNYMFKCPCSIRLCAWQRQVCIITIASNYNKKTV